MGEKRVKYRKPTRPKLRGSQSRVCNPAAQNCHLLPPLGRGSFLLRGLHHRGLLLEVGEALEERQAQDLGGARALLRVLQPRKPTARQRQRVFSRPWGTTPTHTTDHFAETKPGTRIPEAEWIMGFRLAGQQKLSFGLLAGSGAGPRDI